MLNTGLINAFSTLTLEETRADGELWGRLVESLDAFTSQYRRAKPLSVGGDGMAPEEFLLHIAARTLRSVNA